MIYIIAGQTASGKTSLALEFAKLIGAHIINGDAFQVYRELDIGTAKPSKEQQSIVPHHLFDIINIDEQFSIFQYQTMARNLIEELTKKGIPIVIVGGSGLYIRSVLFDYQFIAYPEVDLSEFDGLSNQELHDYLKTIDEESARKIHANNRRRVLRALEIFRASGQTKSALEKAQQKDPYYPYLMVSLEMDRQDLQQRIVQRIQMMFQEGLKQELAELRQRYHDDAPGFRAIGYQELIAEPQLNDDDLIDLIAKHTMQYAKRQNTFFTHQFKRVRFNDKQSALTYLLDAHRRNNHDTHTAN